MGGATQAASKSAPLGNRACPATRNCSALFGNPQMAGQILGQALCQAILRLNPSLVGIPCRAVEGRRDREAGSVLLSGTRQRPLGGGDGF